jgi:hypothetical protein
LTLNWGSSYTQSKMPITKERTPIVHMIGFTNEHTPIVHAHAISLGQKWQRT